MILAAQAVNLPPRSAIGRITLILTAILTLIYGVLRRRYCRITASNALALPLLLAGLYPGAHALVSGVPIQEQMFAWTYLTLCVISTLFVFRLTKSRGQELCDVLAIVAVVFLTYSLLVVVRAYGVRQPSDARVGAAVARLSEPLPVPRAVPRTPDVFHLVLDGMGRPDVLSTRYSMALDGVLARFRRLGFQVDPASAYANYVQTHLSLASMLNVTYLDDLTRLQRATNDREPLRELISRARVPKVFKELGYVVEYIGWSSEWAFEEADICDCPQPWFSETELGSLSLTPLKVFLAFGLGHEPHFRRSLSVFEAFERERTGAAPRYVYAHVMLPHPPFVVDEHGDFRNPRRTFTGGDATFYPGSAHEYTTEYRAQATFTFERALQAATRVLNSSRRDRRDVIIIINGDHGPRLGLDASHPTRESGKFTLPVLLAIYWPADLSPATPPTSLVNVYRAIFANVFGMDLPALQDRGFVSGFTTPYELVQAYP
jgi:hypothetical protein